MNKITISCVPKFIMNLSLAECQLIRALASWHYDVKCRNAGHVGGFLYGWMNQLTPADENDTEERFVSASFGELDLVLKILEVMHSWRDDAERKALRKIDLQIRTALKESNRIMPTLSFEVDLSHI